MANDDHVEGMVAQTRDDMSVTTGSGQHVSRGPCESGVRVTSPTGLLATYSILLLVYSPC
jgi:hypothetical protein